MAIETPGCCDGPNELLRKILLSLPSIAGATATTLQSGSQAIGSGVDTIAVVFPVAYAAIPTVLATVSRPVADPLIYVNIDEASITVNGFTASLGGTTPNANYKLKWMANRP